MFHWLEVRSFSHATEDENRVVAAMRTVLDLPVERESLEGHFGNPIVALTARTDRAMHIKAAWRRLVGSLGKEETLRELDAQLDDEGVYHIRLDKQAAYQGRLERATSDDVIALRAKVAAFPKRREIVVDVLREFVGGL